MNPATYTITFLSFALQLLTISSSTGGNWQLLQPSTGISAMHMQLLRNDRVVIFDRTDFGTSNLSLPDNKCRDDKNDMALQTDCTAHSIEYHVPRNSFRPLTTLTDTWCSSGTVSPDGTLVQTGGFNDGDRTVRLFSPCDDNADDDASCDWKERPDDLAVRRWYATNQILPDGRAFILGGRKQFSYEFYPKSDGVAPGPIDFPFLRQTRDPEENNLYPFVHLNVDGNLFVFSNNRAVLFDYNKNAIVRNYPVMPGGDPRNYPSSGSSVLLPLAASGSRAEVLVCGGAPKGSFIAASKSQVFVEALATCGRIGITDRSPNWSMETMPTKRVMGDMVILPDGKVLIINGAASGSPGWELAKNPVTSPVTYSADAAPGDRFKIQAPTATPRMYHSTAILLRDGRVLVGGSNPHIYYNFSGVEYPTDLSLQAYSPEYLDSGRSTSRPVIITPVSVLNYGKQFSLQFKVASLDTVVVTMVAPSFATHSFSMNQRLLILDSLPVSKSGLTYSVTVTAPGSGNYAPSGYYMVFVVNAGVPSEGIWVHME